MFLEWFPLINLGAWNDDPIVIQAIKEKIDAQLEGLETRLPSMHEQAVDAGGE